MSVKACPFCGESFSGFSESGDKIGGVIAPNLYLCCRDQEAYYLITNPDHYSKTTLSRIASEMGLSYVNAV